MTDIGPDVDQPPAEAPTVQTQYGAPFPVSISFPASVVIKMVDATALNDYEILLFFSSLFFSVFIGFLVATIQATADKGLYIVVTAVFFLSAMGALCWALKKRKSMTAKSREFKLKTSGVEEVK